MAKFEIIRINGEFHYNLKASNKETILSGENYIAKASCIKGINSVKTNSTDEQRFEKRTAKNGEYYFTIKARNGQVIGKSVMYDNETLRNKGMAFVKRNASSAKIVDLTKNKKTM